MPFRVLISLYYYLHPLSMEGSQALLSHHSFAGLNPKRQKPRRQKCTLNPKLHTSSDITKPLKAQTQQKQPLPDRSPKHLWQPKPSNGSEIEVGGNVKEP